MNVSQRYPGITKAAIDIAYDNGGINRCRSEPTMKRQLGRFLDRCSYDADQLVAIDRWLDRLTAEEVCTVCCGEETEAKTFLREREAPPFTDALLNEIFEKVG